MRVLEGPADVTAVPPSARLLRRISLFLARRGAARVLRSAPAFADPDDAFDFVSSFEFAGVGIGAVQIREEIVPFLREVALRRPRAIVEIGTAAGGTLFMLSRAAADDCVLVSVDYAPGGVNHRRRSLYRSFARRRQRIEFVFGDSRATATLERVRDALGGRPVDVLFIDGDHSDPGVRSDYATYAPLVRPGGLIAFHDIVPGPVSGGVPELWQELKTGDARELVWDWDQGGYGIGVLRTPQEAR